MEALSPTLQNVYAELLDRLIAADAARSIGDAQGTFVEKEVKGHAYVYFQFSLPGGVVKQTFVGKKTKKLAALVARFAKERAALSADRDARASLCRALRAGGAAVTDAGAARVVRALGDAGVFKLGGVLVGTHAFIVLGNVLGVSFGRASARTEDVDVAIDRSLEVAVPELTSDVPEALESLKMGFLPVPGFSPSSPSTSFKVRGKGLRLDLVTQARGESRAPVPIPRLRAAAAPLRFIDYLVEGAQPAAVIQDDGVLATVPDPARFALHKLMVAQERPAAFQAKAEKDLAQAALVIEALAELRPGDLHEAAIVARKSRGSAAALKRGREALARRHETAASLLAHA